MILNLALSLLIINGFAALSLSTFISNSTMNNSLSTTTPSFTATILDNNNVDITSSFQIRFYSQPQQAVHPPPKSNSTSSPHERRRVLSRVLNHCPDQHQFVSSHCNAITNAHDSLQVYTLVCRHNRNGGPPIPRGRNAITRHRLRCERHEICVDALSEVEPSNPHYQADGDHIGLITVPTATCVTDDAFEQAGRERGVKELAEYWTAAVSLMMGDAPVLVRAALSRADHGAKLGAQMFSVMEEGSSGSTTEDKGSGEKAICTDCAGVGMKVDEGLEGLKIQAKLMSGVQAGVMGVLWMTAMAG